MKNLTVHAHDQASNAARLLLDILYSLHPLHAVIILAMRWSMLVFSLRSGFPVQLAEDGALVVSCFPLNRTSSSITI